VFHLCLLPFLDEFGEGVELIFHEDEVSMGAIDDADVLGISKIISSMIRNISSVIRRVHKGLVRILRRCNAWSAELAVARGYFARRGMQKRVKKRVEL
jgi:uncharacterized protein YwgA